MNSSYLIDLYSNIYLIEDLFYTTELLRSSINFRTKFANKKTLLSFLSMIYRVSQNNRTPLYRQTKVCILFWQWLILILYYYSYMRLVKYYLAHWSRSLTSYYLKKKLQRTEKCLSHNYRTLLWKKDFFWGISNLQGFTFYWNSNWL